MNQKMKCECGWTGHEKECETKTFSSYPAGQSHNNHGWKFDWDYYEWSNLSCPKCAQKVEEKKDYDQY